MVLSRGMADKVLSCLFHLHCTENRPIHASASEPLGHSEIWSKLLLVKLALEYQFTHEISAGTD